MIAAFNHTEPGGHAQNEDCFQVASHPNDPECQLCVVAEGQGGRAGGAAAATIGCGATFSAAFASTPKKLQLPTTWIKLLQKADRAVADDPIAGFTTLVAFSIWHGWICGASNGDSAAVLLRAGKSGKVLTEMQHKNPPVGSRSAAIVPFAAELSEPWSVLAMTDGVWKYATWEKVLGLRVERLGAEMSARLREAAKMQLTGALQDDFTLVVLQRHAR